MTFWSLYFPICLPETTLLPLLSLVGHSSLELYLVCTRSCISARNRRSGIQRQASFDHTLHLYLDANGQDCRPLRRPFEASAPSGSRPYHWRAPCPHERFAALILSRISDIRAVPALKDAVPAHMHPVFLKDSADALAICNNVTSFTCVCPILPHFLLSLQNKPSLRDIRINAHLTSDQTAKLIQLEALHSITLDNASWNVIDALPKWIIANKSTLTSLTIYVSLSCLFRDIFFNLTMKLQSANELNEQVLERSLVELPRLINLHIINCQNLSLPGVLKCLVYTPLLESLSVTTFMHVCGFTPVCHHRQL